MDSLIPIGSFKRDEIYSFLGGFFIAILWYMYFVNLSYDISVSSVDLVTNPFFLILWLFSTALLYSIQMVMINIVAWVIGLCLRNKNQTEKKKILKIQNCVEYFMFAEVVDDIKIHIHIIGIIITSMSLSLFPFYAIASPFITQNIFYLILNVIVIIYIVLLPFYVILLKRLIVIYLLKADGSLEIADQNTYAQERAMYIAKVKNEESKQRLQNYLDQQKHD